MLTSEEILNLMNNYMINMDRGYGIDYDPGIPEDMIEDFVRDVEKLILSKIEKNKNII